MNYDQAAGIRSVFVGDELKQFAKRLAERQDFAQVVGGEVRPGFLRAGAFAADLDNADDSLAAKNRGGNHLLDEFGGFATNFHAFKNSGVANARDVVDDIRAAIAGRAGGDGRGAGERDKTDLLERFRNEEVEMAPTVGQSHEGDFARLHAEIFGDALGDGGKRDLGTRVIIRFDSAGNAFQFRGEALAGSHGISVGHARAAGREGPGGYHRSRSH